MKNILYLILFVSIQAHCQKVKGYLYDEKGTVGDFPVFNKTQNIYSSLDSAGYFEIQAKIGDSIVLESITHKPMIFPITKNKMEKEFVIELESISLDEIVINSEKFQSKTFSKKLQEKIQHCMNLQEEMADIYFITCSSSSVKKKNPLSPIRNFWI